ncbi:Hypothetical protein D9617_2g055110 [Elsinoe fawcettii]|nr:Hypothetical protein D9617_2g055110 [Elsinoe fawcettii]
MSRLLDCSHEVLHNILTSVEPADLAALSLSCQSLNTFTRDNVLLHKELYLQRWDAPITNDLDYQSSLHSLVRLQKTLSSSSLSAKQSALSTSVSAILPLFSQPSARNTAFLTKHFASQANIDAFLARSSLYIHAGTSTQTAAPTREERQLSARLHVLYGIPVDHASPGCPFRHPPARTNTAGLGVRSPYHILYPRHQAALLNGDADAGAEEQGHYLRSSVRVPANNIARAKVYDLREYTTASLWGPFKGDGSQEVDWEKMESVMVLLGYNLKMFAERTRGLGGLWYGAWEGVSPGSFMEPDWGKGEEGVTGISRLAARGEILGLHEGEREWRSEEERETERRQKELDEKDPYGISGTWMRVVCFLDYNDLYAFNFTRPRERQDDRGIDTREAIRLIKLKLKVTKVEYENDRGDDSDSSSDYTSDPERIEARYAPMSGATPTSPPPIDTPMRNNPAPKRRAPHPFSHYPKVTFVGTSRSLHASWDPNANSRIRGTVRMTPHGDVRWTTWSIFHGEERWRSEGIQVGGPKSARGVLGNWFDKDFEAHGPAGPTAFWKVSNHVIEDKEEDMAAPHPLPFLWPLDDDESDDEEGDGDFDEEEGEGGGEREDGRGPEVEDEEEEEGVGEEGYAEVEVIDEESMGVEFVIEDTRDEVVE